MTALVDEFPKFLKGRSMLMIIVVIAFAFVLAIPMVTGVSKLIQLQIHASEYKVL